MQANSKITELETKLAELQQELTALQMQDKRTPIVWDDQYGFSGSNSEPTSGQLSQKRKKGQAFPPAISYGGFFLSDASMSVLADEPMPINEAGVVITGSGVPDHTAPGKPTHIEDHSSMGEG